MEIRYLTTAEAAQELGLDISRVRCFCEAGRLGRKIGRNWAISEAELEEFKTIRRQVGRPASRNPGDQRCLPVISPE